MKLKEKFQRFWTLSKSHEGFTLVELIVVIAILAILAGVAIPVYNGYIKKANTAADQTLLDAINTSFVAACVENGFSQFDIADGGAKMVISADGSVGSLSKVLLATGKDVTDEVKTAFDFYFEGNAGSKFNTFKILTYANGMFNPGEMSDLYTELMNTIIANNGAQIDSFKNSAFSAIGTDALLGQVTDVASLATDLIKGDSLLTEVVYSDAYLDSLAERMGISGDDLRDRLDAMEEAGDIDGMSQFLANSTVLNVAGTINSDTFNEQAALNKFASGDWSGLGSTLSTDPENGLAEVAMLYGLYTAYDADAAADIALTQDVQALIDLKNDAAFKAYLSEVNTEGSQANKDYQGYKAALTIVNNSANDEDVANKLLEGGYDDAELLAMLQGVLGS